MDKPAAILTGALDQYRVEEQSRSKPSAELGQQQFFDLMVTQLQNQDPFKPMESGDFLGQIAQFSTVNGISELQQSFAGLASALQSSQALQASTMVGRSVVLEADRFALAAGGHAALSAAVPGFTHNVRVTITDARGALVRQAQLGSHDGGRASFLWDGLGDDGQPAPAGAYLVNFAAVVDGEEQALTSAVSARVDSVTLGRDGSPPTLNVDGFGSVAMRDVIEIL